ncbi:hypothetical protein CTI12_AA494440 [Artemisia annua]|uniref:Uncharacterized protein n=1 Tax=Artemisia annua TaxID=35608 RepID=A0A2U1LGA4_ARTAN|nr:hypothetical protein CTI12_AA494440 [Artemisia annua]
MTSFSALILHNHHHILTTVRRRFTTVTPSLTSTFRTFSTITPPLTSTDNLHQLTSDQAVGKVTAVSKNIKRVAVECANSGAWPLDGSHLELIVSYNCVQAVTCG